MKKTNHRPTRLRIIAVFFLLSAAGGYSKITVRSKAVLAHNIWLTGEKARKKGNYKTALKHYRHSLRVDPNHPARAAYIGWFLIYRLNDPNPAVVELDRALKMGHDRGVVHAARGKALTAIKRFREAGDAYERACKHRDFSLAHQAFYACLAGKAYDHGGERKKALHFLQKAYQCKEKRYADYISKIYGELLYRYFRDYFTVENWKGAIRMLDRFEPYIKRTQPDDNMLIQRFPMLYYSIPLRRVVTELSAQTPPANPLRIRFLFVYAFKNSPENQHIEKDIQRAATHMRHLIRHLSEGMLDIVIDRVFMPQAQRAAVAGKSVYGNTPDDTLQVILPGQTGKKLLPLIAKIKDQSAGGYDTVFYFFNGSGFRGIRPSASLFFKSRFPGIPFPAGRTVQGFISIPYNSHRALEGMYVHEYFHLLENRYGIYPKHGFSPDRHYKKNIRSAFPGWKGQGQYDYYLWHFKSTIKPRGYARARHP